MTSGKSIHEVPAWLSIVTLNEGRTLSKQDIRYTLILTLSIPILHGYNGKNLFCKEMKMYVRKIEHCCLSHHDCKNSYNGKHLAGAGQVQSFSPLLSWWEAWWHADRHSAGEGAVSSTSVCKENATLGLA